MLVVSHCIIISKSVSSGEYLWTRGKRADVSPATPEPSHVLCRPMEDGKEDEFKVLHLEMLLLFTLFFPL